MYVCTCFVLITAGKIVEIQCSSEYFTFHEQICYTVSGLSLLCFVLLLLIDIVFISGSVQQHTLYNSILWCGKDNQGQNYI